MSPLLKDYLNKKVIIITTTGHCLVGTLAGYDKSTNLLLSNLVEKSKDIKEREKNVSIQVCRGSEVVCVGLLPEDIDDPQRLLEYDDILHDTKNIVKDEYLIWKKVYESSKK